MRQCNGGVFYIYSPFLLSSVKKSRIASSIFGTPTLAFSLMKMTSLQVGTLTSLGSTTKMGGGRRHILNQRSGRVYHQGAAYHGEHICGLDDLGSQRHCWHVFSEPHDVRPELRTEFAPVPEVQLSAFYVVDQAGISSGARLLQLAVEMKHLGAACAFVQVVYVLGDDADVECFFCSGKRYVGGIRLCLVKLPSSLVVELQD